MGLLSRSMDEVNVVNAVMLANERGIALEESSKDNSDHFSSLIRLEVTGDDGTRSITGTVFDGKNPRLVSMDGCELEITPTGRLLYIENNDKPGVIAGLSTILANAGINIGDFRLGRKLGQSVAVALVGIDSEPTAEVLALLENLENVTTVRYVALEAL